MSPRTTRSLTVAALGLVASAATSWPAQALAQGCAMCKTALEGQNDPLADAINVSVLFMMAMPYAIVGTVGAWIYWNARRRDTLALDNIAPDPERASFAERRPTTTEGDLS